VALEMQRERERRRRRRRSRRAPVAAPCGGQPYRRRTGYRQHGDDACAPKPPPLEAASRSRSRMSGARHEISPDTSGTRLVDVSAMHARGVNRRNWWRIGAGV